MHTAENISATNSSANDDAPDKSADYTASFLSFRSEDDRSTNVSSSSEGEIGDPRLFSFLHDEPRPRGWTDKPLVVLKYVDDFLGIEKLFTANGIRSISEQKMEVSQRVFSLPWRQMHMQLVCP